MSAGFYLCIHPGRTLTTLWKRYRTFDVASWHDHSDNDNAAAMAFMVVVVAIISVTIILLVRSAQVRAYDDGHSVET